MLGHVASSPRSFNAKLDDGDVVTVLLRRDRHQRAESRFIMMSGLDSIYSYVKMMALDAIFGLTLSCYR